MQLDLIFVFSFNYRVKKIKFNKTDKIGLRYSIQT